MRCGRRNWIYDKENIVMKLAAIAAISLATPAMAQQACPASHDDYRHPTPVWGGFGNQVNACPGDKIEVAAKLVVNPNNSFGILKIPQTSAWYLDLAGLSSSQLDNLRDSCQSDLPCVSRFKIRVIEILHTCQAEVLNPWMAKNNNKCILLSQAEKERWQTNEQVIAVLDGWRASDGWEYSENLNYNPPPPKYATEDEREWEKQKSVNYSKCLASHPQSQWDTICKKEADKPYHATATTPQGAYYDKALGGWRVPQPSAPVAPPKVDAPTPPTTPMYDRGLADRTAYENWIAGTSGNVRAGAEYWAGQRSLAQPGACDGSPEFKAGCDQGAVAKWVGI
jgi:hypothetical protein